MDLTIHIALYKSCFVSSTLSCTYENIDIPALYLMCFVSLTCSYENIDTSQFYVVRRWNVDVAAFAIEKCDHFGLTTHSVSPSSKIFPPFALLFTRSHRHSWDVTITRAFLQHRRRSPIPWNVHFRWLFATMFFVDRSHSCSEDS